MIKLLLVVFCLLFISGCAYLQRIGNSLSSMSDEDIIMLNQQMQEQQKINQENYYRQQQLNIQRMQMIQSLTPPRSQSTHTRCYQVGNEVQCDTN